MSPTDRPASSRLVTTKLTAVPQPSTASTSGWLRNTPSNSAAPTPSPSSPQPSTNEASTVPPATTSLQQSLKRRPGESSAPNGSTAAPGMSSAQKQAIKPVWGSVPPPPLKNDLGRGPAGKEIQNDFPTAAEAAHGMCLFPCLPPREVTAIKSDNAGRHGNNSALFGLKLNRPQDESFESTARRGDSRSTNSSAEAGYDRDCRGVPRGPFGCKCSSLG